MPKLTEAEIDARLSQLKDWERLGDMLVKTWRLSSPQRALEFVNRVAEVAAQTDNYPDIVLSYRDVRLELSTHSEGGITEADFAAAAAIDQIPTER